MICSKSLYCYGNKSKRWKELRLLLDGLCAESKVTPSPTVPRPTCDSRDPLLSMLAPPLLLGAAQPLEVSANEASPCTFQGRWEQIIVYVGKVKNEVLANVEQLPKLGVRIALLRNLHHVSYVPSQTRTNNYIACNILGTWV